MVPIPSKDLLKAGIRKTDPCRIAATVGVHQRQLGSFLVCQTGRIPKDRSGIVSQRHKSLAHTGCASSRGDHQKEHCRLAYRKRLCKGEKRHGDENQCNQNLFHFLPPDYDHYQKKTEWSAMIEYYSPRLIRSKK
jgi:hypothetical protein